MKQKLIILVFIVSLTAIGFLYWRNSNSTRIIPPLPVPSAGEVSIKGTIVCLPHKNINGPQTLECAFGLRDNEWLYYSLRDSDPSYKNISSAPMNVEVLVHGMFTPGEDTKYQSVGTIEVQKIALLDVPEQLEIVGTYVCLPHKDTNGPQTDECASGIKESGGTFYALDLAASAQMSPLTMGSPIKVTGIFVPIEQISTLYWQKYNIVGIIKVESLEKL